MPLKARTTTTHLAPYSTMSVPQILLITRAKYSSSQAQLATEVAALLSKSRSSRFDVSGTSWLCEALVKFPNKLTLDSVLDTVLDTFKLVEIVLDDVVNVLVLDMLMVVVNVTGTNSSGRTEIAPTPKCSVASPKTASVELTSLPRNAAA